MSTKEGVGKIYQKPWTFKISNNDIEQKNFQIVNVKKIKIIYQVTFNPIPYLYRGKISFPHPAGNHTRWSISTKTGHDN